MSNAERVIPGTAKSGIGFAVKNVRNGLANIRAHLLAFVSFRQACVTATELSW